MEPGSKFVDYFSDKAWKVGITDKPLEMKLVYLSDLGSEFECKQIGEFRTYTSLDKGNEEILNRFNFLNFKSISERVDSMAKGEEPNKYFDFFRGELFFFWDQAINMDYDHYMQYLSNLEKIMSEILNYCLIVLGDQRLVFVDNYSQKPNECYIWPEIFYFLNIFMGKNERNNSFFLKYKEQFRKFENNKVAKRICKGLKYFEKGKVENLFKKENSLKFINELIIILDFKEEIYRNTVGKDLKEEVIKLPYRNILVYLKQYFQNCRRENLNDYCPIIVRKLLNNSLEILDSYLDKIPSERVNRRVIEHLLIDANLSALSILKSLNKKIKIVQDINETLLNYIDENLIKKLLSKNYFSLIVTNHELISLSDQFILYFLTSDIENEVKFLSVFKTIDFESLSALADIQLHLKLSLNLINEEISYVRSIYSRNYLKILVQLLWTKLNSSIDSSDPAKVTEDFIIEVQGIENISYQEFKKILFDEILQEKHNKFHLELIRRSFDSKLTIGFNLIVDFLEAVSLDYFLHIEKDSSLSKLVFESNVDVEPNRKKELIKCILSHNTILDKSKLGYIINHIKGEESWIESICEWIHRGYLKNNLEYFFENFYSRKEFIHRNPDKFILSFIHAFQNYYLDVSFRKIEEKQIECAINFCLIDIEIEESTRVSIENLLILVLNSENANFNKVSLGNSINHKIEQHHNILKILNLLEKIVLFQFIDAEKIFASVFLKISRENIEKLSDFLLIRKDLIQNMIFMGDSFNEYQMYFIFKAYGSEYHEHPQFINKIRFEYNEITFPKLAQFLLSDNQLFYSLINERNCFSYLCLVVLSCDRNELDENINIQKSLTYFIENSRDDLSYFNILESKIFEEGENKGYNPTDLISRALELNSNKLSDLFSAFQRNKESFIKLRNNKSLRRILVKIYNELRIINLNYFVNELWELTKLHLNSHNDLSHTISINFFKLTWSFLKSQNYPDAFAAIVKEIHQLLINNYLVLKPIEMHEVIYKIMSSTALISEFYPVLNMQLDEYILQKTAVSDFKLHEYCKNLQETKGGLINNSNICYANVIFHLLNNHKELKTYLLQNYSPDNSLTQTILYIFAKIEFSYLSSTNAFKKIKKNQFFSEINMAEQRDTDEFLNEILLYLSIENGEQVYSQVYSDLSVAIQCDKCKNSFRRIEHLVSIPVECREGENISSLLRDYKEVERFQGENQYNCDICMEKCNATQVSTLKKLPETLIVMIKRFQFNATTQTRTKLNFDVKISGDLLIRSEDGGEVEYSLIGIVMHSGGVDSGHYFYYKNTGKNWIYLNDKTSIVLDGFSPDRIENYLFNYNKTKTNPYLLLYSRRRNAEIFDFPNEIIAKVNQKNDKYLKLARFGRYDIISFVVQLIKKNMCHDFVIKYLMNGFMSAYIPAEVFIEQSKKILKAFDKVSYINDYINSFNASGFYQSFFLTSSFILSPKSKTIISILKLVYSKLDNSKKAEYYEYFLNTLNPLKMNLTLHLDMLFSLYLALNRPVSIHVFDSFYNIFASTSAYGTELTFVFRLISNHANDLCRDPLFANRILQVLGFLIEKSNKTQVEALALLCSKICCYLDQYMTQIITGITSSSSRFKIYMLIAMMTYIEFSSPGRFISYSEYFKWFFGEIHIFEYPRLIKLASHCLNNEDIKTIIDQFITPAISNQVSLENNKVIEEVIHLKSELAKFEKIQLEFPGTNKGEFYRDPNTNINYSILDGNDDLILINNFGVMEIRIL